MENQYCLLLETSSRVCSVGLSRNGKIWILKEDSEANGHASKLTLYIQEVLALAELELKDIAAVGFSKGPGSYTGLRIGLSTAKGICYAMDLPLLGLSTLKSIAQEMHYQNLSNSTNHIYLSIMDARRMDAYAAVYDAQMNCVQEDYFVTLSLEYLQELKAKYQVDQIYLGGDAVEKIKPLIEGHQQEFIATRINGNSAKYLATLAQDVLENKQFEDVAYVEPFYLKKPNITKPKSKLFK